VTLIDLIGAEVKSGFVILRTSGSSTS